MSQEKKTKIITIIGVATLLLVVIGATYAYFQAQMGDGASTNINVQADTTDSLTFESSEDIAIYATQQNFAPGMENQSGEATLKAILKANSTTNEAHYTYNVYLDIYNNTFEYTQGPETAELLLQVEGPEGKVETIKGLKLTTSKGISGFDITTKQGPIEIKLNQEIDATEDTGGEQTQEWKFKVILINLDANQNGNSGKELNARLTIQSEKRNYLVLDNTVNGSTYRNSQYINQIKNVMFVNKIPDDIEDKQIQWDLSTSNDKSIVGWLENNNDETVPYDLYIGSNKKMYGTNFNYVFRNMNNLETIDFGEDILDTSLVTSMMNMFQNSSKLTTIKGISNWDVSNVTSMSNMFSSCSNLTTLDLSKWDTSSVTSMAMMFYNTKKLTLIGNISGWNTHKVTSMNEMFSSSGITSLDLSNWNTSNVTNISSMFSSNKGLITLDLSGWDTSNVTNMSSMFWGVSNLTTINGISNWDTSSVINMNSMFYNTSNLNTLDLSKWDTSNVNTMVSMFSNSGLTTLEGISDWDTSSVTDMSSMFYKCQNLTTLDLSGWDTSQVTSMSSMFANIQISNFESISNWDTSQVTSMSSMFANIQISNLESISNWNTSQVTDMNGMFYNCKNLTILDLSGWDTSNVTDMSNMFTLSINLTTLKMNNAKFDQLTDFTNMFSATSSDLEITVNQAGKDWLLSNSSVLSLGNRRIVLPE